MKNITKLNKRNRGNYFFIQEVQDETTTFLFITVFLLIDNIYIYSTNFFTPPKEINAFHNQEGGKCVASFNKIIHFIQLHSYFFILVLCCSFIPSALILAINHCSTLMTQRAPYFSITNEINANCGLSLQT